MRIEFKDAILIRIDSDIEHIPGWCPTCSIGSKNISKITLTFEENRDEYSKEIEEKFFKLYIEITDEYLTLSVSDVVNFIGDRNFSKIAVKEFIEDFKEYCTKINNMINSRSIIVKKIEDY